MSGESRGKRRGLVEEVTTSLTAAEAFDLLQDRPFPFFLDSGMDPQKLGRYSFVGSDPFLIVKSHGEEVTVLSGGRELVVSGNPFDIVGRLLGKYALEPGPSPVPFVGGAVGYFAYDL